MAPATAIDRATAPARRRCRRNSALSVSVLCDQQYHPARRDVRAKELRAPFGDDPNPSVRCIRHIRPTQLCASNSWPLTSWPLDIMATRPMATQLIAKRFTATSPMAVQTRSSPTVFQSFTTAFTREPNVPSRPSTFLAVEATECPCAFQRCASMRTYYFGNIRTIKPVEDALRILQFKNGASRLMQAINIVADDAVLLTIRVRNASSMKPFANCTLGFARLRAVRRRLIIVVSWHCRRIPEPC